MNWIKGKHPAFAHVALGLWLSSLIFDLLARAGLARQPLGLAAFFSIAAGLVAALPAIITGVLDWSEVKKEKPAWKLGLYHMLMNLVVYCIFAINFGLRLRDWPQVTGASNHQMLFSLAGAVLLGFSAWVGARMVYNHGVGVARASKDRLRARAEAAGANVPEAQENPTE